MEATADGCRVVTANSGSCDISIVDFPGVLDRAAGGAAAASGGLVSRIVPHPAAGPLQNYYAWEWGDAMFVVLDPFWYAQETREQRDNWKRSLGAPCSRVSIVS